MFDETTPYEGSDLRIVPAKVCAARVSDAPTDGAALVGPGQFYRAMTPAQLFEFAQTLIGVAVDLGFRVPAPAAPESDSELVADAAAYADERGE